MTVQFNIEISNLNLEHFAKEEAQRRIWIAFNAGFIGFKFDPACWETKDTKIDLLEVIVK